jgi:hypothetical protein
MHNSLTNLPATSTAHLCRKCSNNFRCNIRKRSNKPWDKCTLAEPLLDTPRCREGCTPRVKPALAVKPIWANLNNTPVWRSTWELLVCLGGRLVLGLVEPCSPVNLSQVNQAARLEDGQDTRFQLGVI